MPGQLHGLVAAAAVQHVPAAHLQFTRPGHHGRAGHAATVQHHVQFRRTLVARQVQHHALVDVHLGLLGQQLFQGFQPLHQLAQAVVGDDGGLGGEGRSQRVVQLLDVLVLLGSVHAGAGHALAQALQQLRQAADDLGALFARDLGAGAPDQVGCGALHGPRGVALGAEAHGRGGQHVGPDMEQELAHAFLHGYLVEHLAQLDGVLDGHGLALLDLLRQADALLGGLVLVLEVVLQELLELGQHGLEDAPAGVGVGLDDLHHALDLALQRLAHAGAGAGRAVEAHHAGAHAVDEAARGVVDGGEEVGLADGHAQHRHLQPREPHAHAGRDAVFREDALEQQGHDLDGGAFLRRGRSLLQHLLALVQLFQHHRRGGQRLAAAGDGRQSLADAGLGGLDGPRQTRRQGVAGQGRPVQVLRARGLPEGRHMAADQAVQAAQHGLGMLAAARQRRAARHHAGFLAHVAAPRRAAARTGAAIARGRPVARGRPGAAFGRAAVAAVVAGAGARLPAQRGVRVRAGAADEGPQVDFGQHALRHQPAVDLVVGLFDEQGELVVQHGLQFAPAFQGLGGAAPGLEDHACQHMGTQHVLGVEFVAALQLRHA